MTERELSKLIVKNLGIWETTGVIVYWTRMNSGKINLGNRWLKLAKKGTPDFIVIFRNKENNLSLLFLEAKGTNGYLRPEQREFMNAHKNQKDVHCHVIREQSEVTHLLNTLGIDLSRRNSNGYDQETIQ